MNFFLYHHKSTITYQLTNSKKETIMLSTTTRKQTKFRSTLLDNLQIANHAHSRTERVKATMNLFNFLLYDTFWIHEKRYKKLIPMISEKAYLFRSQVDKDDLPPNDLMAYKDVMDDTLRLIHCNKRVKNRFCKREKKCGNYCTFHTNLKAKFDACVLTELGKFICKDVIGIVMSYVEF